MLQATRAWISETGDARTVARDDRSRASRSLRAHLPTVVQTAIFWRMNVRRALVLVALAASPLLPAPLLAQEVVVCGADELFILDLVTPTPRKVWSCRARERPELPEAMRGTFKTIAECKPTEDGRRLLIASSSHGAATGHSASA